MSSDRVWAGILRWRGVVLISVALVLTVWLAVTNQLILYINPRYLVFTIVMACIALVFLGASFVVRAVHAHEDEPPTRVGKVTTVVGSLIALALVVGMLVVPPATLSSATALQRDVSSSTIGTNTQTVASAASASKATYAKFTVADWSSLLRQTSDPSFYSGKPADLLGFVTPDSDDPENMFYLTRFVITCCAVDAQPIAVPVYLKNWKHTFAANAWLQISGGFERNPSTKSSARIALVPSKTAVVAKPTQPYLY